MAQRSEELSAVESRAGQDEVISGAQTVDGRGKGRGAARLAGAPSAVEWIEEGETGPLQDLWQVLRRRGNERGAGQRAGHLVLVV